MRRGPVLAVYNGAMAKISIVFGVALMALGIGFYAYVNAQSVTQHAPTALIPAAFGVLLVIMGVLARNPARRKTAMHVAAGVGLLGFLACIQGMIRTVRLMAGEDIPRPYASIEQAMMGLLLLFFTGLCVQSFIAARRERVRQSA